MRLTSRRYVLRPALFLLAVATAPGAFAAEAAALSVMIDHAKVMHISRPAEVVIVGNPGIADAYHLGSADPDHHRPELRFDEPDRARFERQGDRRGNPFGRAVRATTS